MLSNFSTWGNAKQRKPMEKTFEETLQYLQETKNKQVSYGSWWLVVLKQHL